MNLYKLTSHPHRSHGCGTVPVGVNMGPIVSFEPLNFKSCWTIRSTIARAEMRPVCCWAIHHRIKPAASPSAVQLHFQ